MNTNRLIDEKSPYLLQHAHNPVDWYPWGVDAFRKAQEDDKPIFLSIGYSTCHWCHVMERECFEDEQVAKLLNDNFVSIKVDREERPDIDSVYMDVCQALNGSGGWPLSIIMSPSQKPFFAATYIPKSARYGTIGMTELLPRVTKMWTDERHKISNAEDAIVNALNSIKTEGGGGYPSKELLSKAVSQLKNNYDSVYGGFGPAPKFPSPHTALFLLRYSAAENDADAREMAETTLTQMYRGGIFDHIGGGFSRYSTDEKWLVPHFEKMLYDNAMLIYVYAEAYQLTKNSLYKKTAEKTLGYALRELLDANGGFYCGQDADSGGIEGKYYTFTPEEIKNVLGTAAEQFCRDYDITPGGNFEGASIPNLLKAAELPDTPYSQLKKLLDYRLGRCELHKDDKVLTSWNGLMLAALSKAARVFDEPLYYEAAHNLYTFINTAMNEKDGGLLARWRDSESGIDGKIDDYAFYCFGLLEMYDSTADAEYLKEAVRLAKIMMDRFFDSENGGFYLYSTKSEQLITRPKETFDGSMPSGNSAAAYVLARLAALTAEPEFTEAAEKQLGFLASRISDYPAGSAFALTAMLQVLYPSVQIICTANDTLESFELLKKANESYSPNLTVIVKNKDNAEELGELAPFTKEYSVTGDKTAFYVCRNGACAAPVTSIDKLTFTA